MKISKEPLLDDHLTTVEQKTYANYWLVATFGGTLLFGMVAAYLRPYFDTGGVHWDAILSLIILTLLNVACLYKISKSQYLHFTRVYNGNTILIWLGFYLGWMIIDTTYMDELAFICGLAMLIGILIGNVVLYFQQK